MMMQSWRFHETRHERVQPRRKVAGAQLAQAGALDSQPVREAVSYRGLFTADWFGVRKKHCFRLEIYDRLRENEQAERCCGLC